MDQRGTIRGTAGTEARPIRALTLAVTGRCNLACRHCLVDAGPEARHGHVPGAELRRVVEELAALGGEEIWLTGGEPLLHPDVMELLALCRAQPSLRSVGLQTNGALLGEDHVEALRALAFEGLSIQVSLDGASPRTHDRVRGSGSFRKTVEGLRRLAAAGLAGHVSIAFTEMRHNMEDVPALLAFVEELGARSLVAGTLVADGRAARGGLAAPTPDQVRALLARWRSDAELRAGYERCGSVAAIEWWKGRHGAGEECCTFSHPYVTADGTVYPCALCRDERFAVRGAFGRPLGAVLREARPAWSALAELKRRRRGALPACQGCVGLLHCGGGCAGRAHAATGDLMAVEDRCELRKAVYTWEDRGGATCR